MLSHRAARAILVFTKCNKGTGSVSVGVLSAMRGNGLVDIVPT